MENRFYRWPSFRGSHLQSLLFLPPYTKSLGPENKLGYSELPIGTPSCPQTVPPPAPDASLCPSQDRVKHHPVRPRGQIPSPSLQSGGVRQDPASASPSSPQAQLRFPSLGTCGPHCAVSHMSLKASSCPLLLLHVSLSFLTSLRLSGGLCPISQEMSSSQVLSTLMSTLIAGQRSGVHCVSLASLCLCLTSTVCPYPVLTPEPAVLLTLTSQEI